MEKKKIKIKLETKLPRRKLPPPGKVFTDKKKEANKKHCRKENYDY